MEGINSDERYFEGLLTVQMKDKQGEVTIVDELYKVLPVWIDRGAPISDTHSNRIVGKGINYSRTTVKGDDGAELPAIKITGKIFKNYELDNVIWEKIKNNEYKGLSFGGATRSARSPIKMKDGSTAYALSDLEHYEVAVCKDPAVPMAIITDFNQIAKANFNSTVRDDGKMVIQCSNMSCMVKKDDEEDEEFYHDEEGEIRDDIEKAKGDYCPNCGKGKKDLPDTATMGGACPNCGHGFKSKFMEKKEMFEAVTDNPEEDTKAKITKGDGSTNTEDRNNRSDLNDLVRDKRQFNGTRGTLSEELPNMTIANPIKNGKNAADLNESQTFEQKVQALIREGKSRESAEKIVGSFVHKEAAGGNGMGGGANSSGSGGMSGGGTLTTDSGGTNNPVHNNGCDCTCKDCKRNDKCDCCEKCKRKSKGLDISNTNSVGTSSAYNQDAPNGSRLNNKADEDKPLNKPMRDDGDKKFKVYVKDPTTGKTVTVRFGDPNMEIKRDDPERRSSFRARHDCDNAKDITTPQYWSCKMWEKETSVTEHTNKATPASPETKETIEWLRGYKDPNRPRPKHLSIDKHKAKATREVNKVHALMKLNKVKTQLGGFAEESAQARIRDQSSNTTPKPRTGNAPIKGDSQGTWNERNYPNRIDDAKLTPSSESTSYAANDDHERERTYNQGTKQLPKGGKSPKDLGKALEALTKK